MSNTEHDEQRLYDEVMRYVDDAHQTLEKNIRAFIQARLQHQSTDTLTPFQDMDERYDGFDTIVQQTANSATRQILSNGNVNLDTLARRVLRRTGRSIGENIARNIFNGRGNTNNPATNQLGAELFDGLLKSRRNR